MRPVVFLDIDGVLVTRGTQFHHFDPECVKALNWLTSAADARIVLSSSWRHMPGIRDIIAGARIEAKVIGITPDLNTMRRGLYPPRPRGDEIMAWFRQHAQRRFVILDDDADMGKLMPYLVRCGPDAGLTLPLAELALKILER